MEKISGQISFKKAIRLSIENIRNLTEILLRYCSTVRYEIRTVSDIDITYKSIDELEHHDNFKDTKIISLSVIGSGDNNIRCVFNENIFVSLHNTFVCYYNVQKLDNQKILSKDIHKFLDKIVQPYYFINKINLFSVFTIILLFYLQYLSIKSHISLQKDIAIDVSTFDIIIAIVLYFGTLFLLFYIFEQANRIFHKYLFLSIVFDWGEEHKIDIRREKFKSQIFWGVLVTIIVSIAASIIANHIS